MTDDRNSNTPKAVEISLPSNTPASTTAAATTPATVPTAIRAAECYRAWTAYDALCQARLETNYRSVWNLLQCPCCPEPPCWSQQEILPIPERWRARIRWYDNVQQQQQFYGSVPLCGDGHAHGGDAASSKSASDRRSQLTPEAMRSLQDHFVSHHQRIELVLHCLKPGLESIYQLVEPHCRSGNLDDAMPPATLQQVLQECYSLAQGWHSVGQLVRGVATMDRIDYLAYAPRLAGVSGGNSPLMMSLTARTGNLEALLFRNASADATAALESMARAMQRRTPTGQLAEAFITCLDAVSRCWFEHVVTATTTIGITCGTKGTPNTTLADRVLKRLHSNPLLLALGSLRNPITGMGIEMYQVLQYNQYSLAGHHYLDLFVDPGPEFGTHNIGWQPKEYEKARTVFSTTLRRTYRTGIWQYFYDSIRPELCHALRTLLGLPTDETAATTTTVGFGLGSSVTEVLSRLMTTVQLAVPKHHGVLHVILAKDEFVTLQRAAAILGQGGAKVTLVSLSQDIGAIATTTSSCEDDEKKDDASTPARVTKLVFISLVNSCTQRVESLDWVTQVPASTIVVIDITQAVGNIPLQKFGMDVLATLPNIFLVGSLIKHARCGEGLGFMTYSEGPQNRLLSQPASGWASYCSGLRDNQTADFSTNALYYDNGIEWDGGTPSYVEAAFVATRVLKVMPPVTDQHKYVKHIQDSFLEKAKHLLSDTQRAAVTESNTLAVPVSDMRGAPLPFGLDYKVVNDTIYLRIGFGVHNLEYHLMQLVQFFEESGSLS